MEESEYSDGSEVKETEVLFMGLDTQALIVTRMYKVK